MFKKIFISIIVLLFLCIAAIVAVPFLFKDQINAMIKDQINKEVLADVDYSSYDLSIIKSFPDLYFSLDNLTVVGRDEFEGDTLADVRKVGIGLELMKFIRGEELLINSVYLEHPQVITYKLVNEEGDTLSNYDILPSTDGELKESDLIDITAKDIKVLEGNFYFKDFLSGTELIMNNLQLDASVDYIGDLAEVVAKSTIESLSFDDGKVSYLNDVKLDADVDITADLAKDSFAFRDNVISLNALKVYADGHVVLPDENTTKIDLSFAADKSNFKELLSLIPTTYLKDYQDVEANGEFILNGKVKGFLTSTLTPTFDVNLDINNGSIHYPGLPSSIDQINFEAKLKNNSSQIEKMSVDIPKASFRVADEMVEMQLFAENALGDPHVDLKLKGDINLQKIPEYYPLEGVNSIGGQMATDVAFKGLLSDVENENFENVDFAGDLKIKDFQYDATDFPMPLEVKDLSLDFTPQYANLQASNAVIGQSDFNVNGKVENLINYVLADGIAKGTLDIQSTSINLDELMGEDDEAENSTSTATKVPENLDFVASLQADKVFYDGLELSRVDGGINLKDERLDLEKLSLNMLGGSAKLNGSYSTKNTDRPQISLAYDINKFDIKQTFEQLNTIRAIAPLAKYLTGSFSTDMNLTSFLNNDLSLDLAALNGLGEVRIPYATFNDLPIFQKVSETIKLPAFDKPSLNNAWTVLKFDDGQVRVEPFQVKMKDILMDIEGTNGLDQSINYTMKLRVPSDKFGGAAGIANDFLSKKNIPLLNLAVPQALTFHLNVGGMMNKPTVSIVKVTADENDKAIKDQIKDKAKEEFESIKEEVKEEAKEVVKDVWGGLKENVTNGDGNIKEEAQNEIDKVKENLKDKFKGWK